ncbi:SagB family peptide dehydrogenase [Cystobacter fuscus]|uniref:SagB family peptide dehydrogenase n=1 Tax=Cystobacter fuscus TaxID=43 RepID=UPI0006877B45|nr:SagB family peptide dehydrogenase [Cystobacter fuscus]
MSDSSSSFLHVAFSAGLRIEQGEDGPRLWSQDEPLALGVLPRAIWDAFTLLVGGSVSEEALVGQVERAGGFQAVVFLHVILAKLARRGALRYLVQGPVGTLATLEPLSPRFELSSQPLASVRRLRLSRFAHVRRDGEALVLESPRAHGRVVLGHAAALALLAGLAMPTTPDAAVERLAPHEVPAALTLLELLFRTGFVLAAESDGSTEEERRPALALWEFHDLLFHAGSRRRLYGRRVGGTYRLAGTVAPLPAVPPPSEPAIALPRPDLALLARSDPPLVEAMERRRSHREPGARGVTLAHLGELLFRCARVRQVRPGERDEESSRPHPSGGARYPLETYVVVGQCEGLEPGLYHHDAAGHRLEQRGGMTPTVRALLADAQVGSHPPRVLLILAARFARTSFKYESIAYALILKEAGVLLQSLSLAATAMGLAACVVGRGNPELFEHAAATEGVAESSVAEFAIHGCTPEGRPLAEPHSRP